MPPPDEVYSLFGDTGKLGEVPGKNEHRADPSWIPIEWRARVDRGATMKQPFALAIEGSWPDLGPESKELPLTDPSSVSVVADYLKSHGIKEEAPLLTQAYEVDLIGDGQMETLICAHSDETSLRDDQAAEIYALVLLRSGTSAKGAENDLARQSILSIKPAGQIGRG